MHSVWSDRTYEEQMSLIPWLKRYAALLTAALHWLGDMLETMVEGYVIECTMLKKNPDVYGFTEAITTKAIEGAFIHPMRSHVTGAFI